MGATVLHPSALGLRCRSNSESVTTMYLRWQSDAQPDDCIAIVNRVELASIDGIPKIHYILHKETKSQ